MMRIKLSKIIAVVFAVLGLSGIVQAGNGGYAGAYLRMGLGARSLAMGNTGLAHSFNGFASYYNPAGLPRIPNRQLSLSYSFLSLDRQFHFTGFALPLKPSAGISIAWIHAGVRDIQGRNSAGEPDEIYQTGEDVFYLSFANAFHPKLSIGVTLKILNHSLLDLKGNGIGFDLGLLFHPLERLNLALTIRDLASRYNWNTQNLFEDKGSNYAENFPVSWLLGASYRWNEQILTAADCAFSDKGDFRIRLGVEWHVHKLGYLRAGWNHSVPTLGGGLEYQFFGKLLSNLDYSLLLGIVGEGTTHVFSWIFKF
jgi:hypothetical protein